MNQRILITGASGFLGQMVACEAARQGVSVVGMGQRDKPSVFEGVWYKQNPFDDATSLPEVDACIHLAWPTAGNYANAPENAQIGAASLRLALRLREKGCTHMVVAGTCAEYASTQQCPITEDGLLADENAYSKAKNTLHRALVLHTKEKTGPTVAWARIFQVYGPGEREQRLLPHLARLWQDGTVFQAASCTQVRDYLHVVDVASALVLLATRHAAGVYNICSGQPVRLYELILMFGKHFPCGSLVDFGVKPERDGWEPPILYGSNKKLCGLGWRQTIPLHEGVATYARFLQETFSENTP